MEAAVTLSHGPGPLGHRLVRAAMALAPILSRPDRQQMPAPVQDLVRRLSEMLGPSSAYHTRVAAMSDADQRRLADLFFQVEHQVSKATGV